MGRIVLVALCIFLLFSCGASASFPYRYYVLKADSYKGKLLGNKPENDLDLGVCEPKPGKLSPCITFLKDELIRLKNDHEAIQEELKCWQSGRCK